MMRSAPLSSAPESHGSRDQIQLLLGAFTINCTSPRASAKWSSSDAEHSLVQSAQENDRRIWKQSLMSSKSKLE